MRGGRHARTVLAGALLAWAGLAGAQPVTVAGLQRALQEAPQTDLRFHETRESKWLALTLESSGRMKSSPAMLEKEVEQPKRERWRILDDRMQLIGPDAGVVKQLLFSDAPAVAALAQALRHVMAGDLQALDRDFRLHPAGDEHQWSLQLVPRHAAVARVLNALELHGSGAQLQTIVVVESQGDRTTTRLTPQR